MSDTDLKTRLDQLTPRAREKLLEEFKARTSEGRRAWYCAAPGRECDGKPHAGYDYPHARGDQWPPPNEKSWLVWGLFGGRGSGKTRSASEYVRSRSQDIARIALIAPTSADIRDTMIDGDSGILAVCQNAGAKAQYYPSKRRIVFASGARASLFSAEEPDRLRGPQFGLAWLDEPAHMSQIVDVWDMMMLGLRLGDDPKVVVSTTPTPIKWVRDLQEDDMTVVVRASTYKNLDNLAPTFRKAVLNRYEGTRLGRQELHGETLEDVEGALWNASMIERSEPQEKYDRIVVSIDPAGTTNKRSDETGIVVVAVADRVGYVLEDLTGKYSPKDWADAAIRAYTRWNADAIMAEKNFGGDMVKANLQATLEKRKEIARIIVTTASKSKELRAEPIVGLYEQHRVFHVGKMLERLENEMLTWVPGQGKSPNRVDALVHGITELIKPEAVTNISSAIGRSIGRRGAEPRQRRMSIWG